jgi:hypothetical protein
MNQVWQLAPEQRLKEWRKLRKQIEDMDDDECLDILNEWWSSAPLSSRVIDPYSNEHWPDPWKLLYNGDLDENVIGLGMAYTLELIGWECELLLVQSVEKGMLRLIIVVDEDKVLNYNHNEIATAEVLDDLEIIKKWESSELT